MMTYSELIELRQKLANGEIALELSRDLFWKDHKEGKRSWQTKDWKERRAKVIKDKCEVCGSKETLTLQHHSHPRKYADYERDVTKKYAQSLIESNSVINKTEFSEYVQKTYEYEPVPLCPNCEGRKPNRRMRKTPQYLCTKCKHEFNEPVYKVVNELIESLYENEEAIEVQDKCFVSKDQWNNQYNLWQIRSWMLREMAKTKDIASIGKEAFLLYLDDNIKYLSFEDTITACKKCAFNLDLNNLELCPKCKEYYKGIEYPTCIQCLPEGKRKMALAKVEFGKGMRDMHESLGID